MGIRLWGLERAAMPIELAVKQYGPTICSGATPVMTESTATYCGVHCTARTSSVETSSGWRTPEHCERRLGGPHAGAVHQSEPGRAADAPRSDRPEGRPGHPGAALLAERRGRLGRGPERRVRPGPHR